MIIWAPPPKKSFLKVTTYVLCFNFSLNSERKQKKKGSQGKHKNDEHCYFAERLMVWEELISLTSHSYRNLPSLQNTEGLTSCSSVQGKRPSWGQCVEEWPGSEDPRFLSTVGHFDQLRLYTFPFKLIRLKFTRVII